MTPNCPEFAGPHFARGGVIHDVVEGTEYARQSQWIQPEKVDSHIPVDEMPPWANPGLIDYHENHKLRFSDHRHHECEICQVTWSRDQGDHCWFCGGFRRVWAFEKENKEKKEVA